MDKFKEITAVEQNSFADERFSRNGGGYLQPHIVYDYQGEKVDIECKKAEKSVPKSAYESYSAFANTKGGYIILGVREDKTKTDPKERFIIRGEWSKSR